MIRIIRTGSDNSDFLELVKELDADLAERDGKDHAFYAQFNKTGMLKHAVVVYEDAVPVACGAVKELDSFAMEVKRMYTRPAYRGKGLASKVLTELENWVAELSYPTCRLETGKNQPEALAFYKKQGYTVIENYGQYAGINNSVCFEKTL